MACDGLNLYLADDDLEDLKNGKKIIFDNFELVHRIIEHAMEKRDRSVSIFFGEGGVSINVYPYPEENEEDEEQ